MTLSTIFGALGEDCPQLRQNLLESTNDHFSILCKGDQVAEWLQKNLISEISLSQFACGYRSKLKWECAGNLSSQYPVDNDMTWEAAAEIFPSYMTAIFHCTVNGIRNTPSSECGLSWQDSVIITWLFHTIEFNPPVYLPQNCIAEMMALKNGNGPSFPWQ